MKNNHKLVRRVEILGWLQAVYRLGGDKITLMAIADLAGLTEEYKQAGDKVEPILLTEDKNDN